MRVMTGRSLWSRIEPISDEWRVQASLEETFRCLETRIELTELTELTGCQQTGLDWGSEPSSTVSLLALTVGRDARPW